MYERHKNIIVSTVIDKLSRSGLRSGLVRFELMALAPPEMDISPETVDKVFLCMGRQGLVYRKGHKQLIPNSIVDLFYECDYEKTDWDKLHRYQQSLITKQQDNKDVVENAKSENKISIELIFSDNRLFLGMRGERMLLHTLQDDGRPANVIKYIFDHPNIKLSNKLISRTLFEVSSKLDIAEILKKAGLNQKLKKLFFPICEARVVKLTPKIRIEVPIAEQLFKAVQTAKHGQSGGKKSR